jgi:hypothetical protein
MKNQLEALHIDELEDRVEFSVCSVNLDSDDEESEKSPPSTGGDHGQISDSKQTDPDV